MPGQVYYQTTRKLVLQGADGVVFVADSQSRQLDENIESFQDLHANLAEQGIDARSDAARDSVQQAGPAAGADPVDVAELSDAINFRDVPEFAADALHGPGVFETLRGISELVLRRLSAAGSQPAGAGSE